MNSIRRIFVYAILFVFSALASAAQTATVIVDAGSNGKLISPDLVGIFFEDINYAADGGLYAELVQNRFFEYQATEQPTWNNLTSWELVQRGAGQFAHRDSDSGASLMVAV